MLNALEADGVSLAYTTVSTVLDRLAERSVIRRSTELHAGSRRYRYAFDADAHAGSFVASVLDDVTEEQLLHLAPDHDHGHDH